MIPGETNISRTKTTIRDARTIVAKYMKNFPTFAEVSTGRVGAEMGGVGDGAGGVGVGVGSDIGKAPI